MHWEVQLTGDSTDLGMIADTFTTPNLKVERRGQEHVISSTDFETLTSAGEVRDRARDIVTALSGSARLALGSRVRLGVGAVYRIRDDGKRDITVFPEPLVMQVRVLPVTMSVQTPDGRSEVHRPADPISEWLPLVQQDPLVAKALRLRDHDSLKWVDLYRIYEVIESDVGPERMIKLGWITKSHLERFARTANSVTAAGDDSRHGRERTDPPPKPLLLREGRALVDDLLHSWLKWRSSQRPSSA